MIWRYRTALVGLILLVGLPATATICAMTCATASAAAVASHHGSGAGCEQAPPGAATLASASAGDCDMHPATVLQALTTAAARADVRATTAPFIIAKTAKTAEMNVPLEIPRDHGSIVDPNPPGPKPPKKKTPVLRV